MSSNQPKSVVCDQSDASTEIPRYILTETTEAEFINSLLTLTFIMNTTQKLCTSFPFIFLILKTNSSSSIQPTCTHDGDSEYLDALTADQPGSDDAQARQASTEHEREHAQDAKSRSAGTRLVFADMTDAKVQSLTSIPCRTIIQALTGAIRMGLEDGKIEVTVKSVDLETQVVIALTKLRHNPTFEVMSVFWGIEKSTVIEIFDNIVELLHGFLWQTIIKPFGVPGINQNLKYLPEVFKYKKNCRLILDRLDVPIHKPKTDDGVCHTSVKFLIGISPSGLVCFVSPAFGARAKDDDMCDLSGFWNIFEPGDLVLVREGVTILNAPSYVILETPPSKGNDSTSTSSLWAHVERSVERIKLFKILHQLSSKFQDRARILTEVCAALVNLQTPVMSKPSPLSRSSKPDDGDREPEVDGESDDDYY